MILKAKKIFTVYMVLTVLVSSNTFAYYEHVCLLTKVKSLSLQPYSCSSSDSEKKAEDFSPHFQKKTCCDLNLIVKKVDQSNFHNFSFNSIFNNFFALIEIPLIDFQCSPINLLKPTLGFTNTSPPFFLEKIYIFISVLRI
jgi:hypothetical protein